MLCIYIKYVNKAKNTYLPQKPLYSGHSSLFLELLWGLWESPELSWTYKNPVTPEVCSFFFLRHHSTHLLISFQWRCVIFPFSFSCNNMPLRNKHKWLKFNFYNIVSTFCLVNNQARFSKGKKKSPKLEFSIWYSGNFNEKLPNKIFLPEKCSSDVLTITL